MHFGEWQYSDWHHLKFRAFFLLNRFPRKDIDLGLRWYLTHSKEENKWIQEMDSPIPCRNHYATHTHKSVEMPNFKHNLFKIFVHS